MAHKIPIRLGILGGGQLAQMLALASRQVGVLPVILAKDPLECALQVVLNYAIDDGADETLRTFFDSVDVVTIENEFIDRDRFRRVLSETQLEKLKPRIENLELVQSKRDQKTFLKNKKVPHLPFIELDGTEKLTSAFDAFEGQVVFKKSRLGYDGRGTFIFKGSKDHSRFEVWKGGLGRDFDGYAEPLAFYTKEISVVGARNEKGQMSFYPVVETRQSEGICQWAVTPAAISKTQTSEAITTAKKIMSSLKAVGVFAVEMFVLKNGNVVVNEIAPRVHNSGHLTMNGAVVSQFEQHVRAVCGLPLGETTLISPSAMVNIIGDNDAILGKNSTARLKRWAPHIWVHWYGKTGKARKRKLGHINSIGKSTKSALKVALACRKSFVIEE